MLPRDLPAPSNHCAADVSGRLVAAREVGGDLYDYFVRDEKLYFCIGDVSGKSVPSALVMAVTQALFHACTQHVSQPAQIMNTINVSLSRNNERNMFVTFFIGVLDLPTGRLRCCNAGHNPPVIIDNGATMMQVKPNLPLGVMDGFKYEAQELQLQAGTTLFMYTDGITEALDTERQLFGERRMLDALEQCVANGQTKSQQIVNHITREVHQFTQGTEQSDDITLLAIGYTPQQYSDVLNESITLDNDVKQIPELNEFVASVTAKLSMEPTASQQVKLAVEEAVVNVMEYAYPHGAKGKVEVNARSDGKCLKVIIADRGIPFDPTARAKADTTLSVEERPIGGLGIFLVRQMMDTINYEHFDGKNILTLSKYYNKEP
jgi:sigma-B regulation protein RsbU (phosphoserine phosphatase)